MSNGRKYKSKKDLRELGLLRDEKQGRIEKREINRSTRRTEGSLLNQWVRRKRNERKNKLK